MAWQYKDDESIVISVRIRLARNFCAYPFPQKMDDKQAADIVYLVEQGLNRMDRFEKYDIGKLSKEDATLLQEQYLISPALIKSKRGAAFVSWDGTVSVMVNEEDHLREQYICKGCDFFKAYERISALDDVLGSMYDFAFDDRLGYLTACPSNLGTGLRASVMMFLPGLALGGGLKTILPTLKADGLTVRGAFGEGTMADGYVYQISNERTLGVSETDILKMMRATTEKICQLEKQARAEMLAADSLETKDRCLRAYGVLTHCAVLTMKEFFAKMADIKLGVLLGFLETDDFTEIHDFIDGLRPMSFRVSNGLQGASEKECDVVRAETVRKVLPELVRVCD
ncbi:MAG: ATP--guanido phosphotransferase [Clostridia bacterium]|nr:ATP--guanido phosphotransferase [Clostridia bacterium]